MKKYSLGIRSFEPATGIDINQKKAFLYINNKKKGFCYHNFSNCPRMSFEIIDHGEDILLFANPFEIEKTIIFRIDPRDRK